ncbi:MAG: hypothetical protein JSS81_26930 [Acidobacteria bacterium]|nr:hypothetical protein [Acidobacteriota bacterium]
MFKKIGVKLMILLMVGVMSVTDLSAQTRIRFARGANSATVRGTLAAGSTRGYVLRASAGQVLTGALSSGNGKCDFTQGAYHDTQYSQTIERNGDVYISIDNHGSRATTFTLTISIQ